MNSEHAARVTRRRLLQVGGVGMLGLDLVDLLRAAESRTHSRKGNQKSCVFVCQYGGASHIDTLDPKPDAPEEIRGPYKPIATRVPGIRVTDMLPRLAAMSDRYCLVRSMSHKNSGHDGGMKVCMTGSSQPASNMPCFGSVLAKLKPSQSDLPSYVWLQNLDADVQPWYLTGGFLGAAYSPLRVGVGADNASAPGFRLTTFDPPQDVSPDRLLERRALLRGLNTVHTPMPEQGLHRLQERAMDMCTGPEARRAFDLQHEPAQVRDRYGRHPLGQNLLLARRLIEAGVRLVSVNAWAGVPNSKDEGFIYSPSFTQGWDHHGAAVQQCGIFSTGQFGLGLVLPRFDQALSAFLEDLEQRGLLDSTLVVVVGEFGRTPKITSAPYPGRDHWPQCYTALLAGAGVRGGMVYGASDKIGAYPSNRPVSPEDFGATLFHTLGVPPETRFGPDGFSNRVSEGEPLLDLFG